MPCSLDPLRLVAWLDGDLSPAAGRRLEAHLAACPKCSALVGVLQRQEEALRAEIGRAVPTAVLARLRHSLPPAEATSAWPDVMTLDEVARYLRIALDDLDRFASDLPAFEVAGQVRVRRTELVKWISRREQDHAVQRLHTEATLGLGRRVG